MVLGTISGCMKTRGLQRGSAGGKGMAIERAVHRAARRWRGMEELEARLLLSSFYIGERIEAASGGANVRTTALTTVLYTQYGGVHGTIVGVRKCRGFHRQLVGD